MAVTIFGLPCIEPASFAASCQTASPPLPLQPWFGLANRFTTGIGLRAGRGHLLLSAANVNALPPQTYVPLTFASFPVGVTTIPPPSPTNGGAGIVTTPVRAVGTPVCVSPGWRGDPAATFLVEVADRRVDSVGWANQRYNWRIFPDAPYETFSINDDTNLPWTWSDMIEDLWYAVGNLGVFPGLPWVPTTRPEQIDATGTRAADVLEDLLLLNGYGIYYDNLRDTFSIVDFSIQASPPDLLNQYDAYRLWDQEPKIDLTAQVPQYASVAFPVWSPGGTPISTASYYVVDVNGSLPGAVPNSTVFIQDYMACRTDQTGAILNGEWLAKRAKEVAGQFFTRIINNNWIPLMRSYSGVQFGGPPSGGTVSYSILWDLICWEDMGDGVKTHIASAGRMGTAPLFFDISPSTGGQIRTDHPGDLAYGQMNANLLRAGNWPPGESRRYKAGPLYSDQGASALTMGVGDSPIWVHAGPLRQWDDAVDAMAVDGQGHRLWAAPPRPQFMCFVLITSNYARIKFTIGGTPAVGLTYKITIGGATVTYTAILGDTTVLVATGLAAACAASGNANFTALTWTASGSVVTGLNKASATLITATTGGTGQMAASVNCFAAVETFLQPISTGQTSGDVCVYSDVNDNIPTVDDAYLCYLDGSFPEATALKLYMNSEQPPPTFDLTVIGGGVSNGSVSNVDQITLEFATASSSVTGQVTLTPQYAAGRPTPAAGIVSYTTYIDDTYQQVFGGCKSVQGGLTVGYAYSGFPVPDGYIHCSATLTTNNLVIAGNGFSGPGAVPGGTLGATGTTSEGDAVNGGIITIIGTSGFTGTGAYTIFTIVNGQIILAT